jgi:hypothetical protein
MRSMLTQACLSCGREFLTPRKEVARGKGLFCSRGCRARHTARPPRPILERFLQDAPTGLGPLACWPWGGSLNQGGYGRLRHVQPGGIRIAAHRLSYLLFVGPVPSGLYVLHHCDNPPCVNPRHLWLGTAKDNIHDCFAKGRRGRRG